MLKNIKLFSTDSARTSYEGSANYETPYVSKVIADNSVHYNKVVQPITFTIDSIQYQAIEGMTWGEWVNSEYNTGGFIFNSECDRVMTSNLRDVITINGDLLLDSDTVTAGTYQTTTTDCNL